MQMSRRGSGPVAPDTQAGHGPESVARPSGRVQAGRFPRYLFGALIAASIGFSAAQAATFGHSRIISALGQPLHLEIPVTQLTPQEVDSLRAFPAPAEAWREAGMTPPVALDSMRLVLLDGYRPDVKVIQLRSDQSFDQPIVDILLDVRSVAGQQRYQVSLLAHADTHAVQRAGGESARHPRAIDGRDMAGQPGGHAAAGRQIQVRSGDNMFAVAGRNEVRGVTVYQMMIALQRANPQAFIEDNVNLVKAGATLVMPDMDALTALSDREARRVFQQHAQAFARYRQRSGGTDVAALSTMGSAAQGGVLEAAPAGAEPASTPGPGAGGDRLRLSGGPGSSMAAGASALSGGAENGPSSAGQVGHASAAGSAGGAMGAREGNGNASAALSSNGAAGIQGGATAADAPGVSLLASSGVIASDAVADKAPISISSDTANGGSEVFGSDAASGGTVLKAGSGSGHPDDQAAMLKGMDESQKRILELEDNVRHLNEALQKQGHVAAEAALEGARSVSEAIKEVMGIIDPDEDAGQAAEGLAAGQPGGVESSTATESPAGVTANSGGTHQAPSVPGQSAAAAAGGSAGTAATQSRAAREGVSPGPSTSSLRTGKQVSWLQENMLALIGGGLALIVLIVVWLLRRASTAKRDIFESDSPITDSMVRDKLREIDLDLEAPSSGGAGPRAS